MLGKVEVCSGEKPVETRQTLCVDGWEAGVAVKVQGVVVVNVDDFEFLWSTI